MPYLEEDPPCPISKYGASKLKGDIYVMNSGCNYFLIRISWLYGKQGINFIDKVYTKLLKENEISVVSDQIGSLTSAYDLAELTYFLTAQRTNFGIYNFTGEGESSWYDVANFISRFLLERNKVPSPPILHALTSEQANHKFNLLAVRPKYSYLSKYKIHTMFKIEIKYWQKSLLTYLELL
jgi:dTDP-4-dehydrorhamnose reductase